jgi:hypothetical protein
MTKLKLVKETPYKLVTLNNFYRHCDDSRARELLGEIAGLRKSGYGPDYPENYLPMDGLDLISWHHLICDEVDGELRPVAGYRNIAYKDVAYHGFELPLVTIAKDSGADAYVQAFRDQIQALKESNRELVNSAYFTISKPRRGDPQLSTFVKEICAALAYEDTELSGKTAMLTSAALRFKTDRYFHELGFRPFTQNGKNMEPFRNKHSGGEVILPMILLESSEWNARCYEKYSKVIENRVVIGDTKMPETAKKAA